VTPLQLPKSIGGYEILGPLASGGMGAVLLGEKVTAQGFKKRVAIKVILPHLLGDAQARALFFDEARLAARFNHPNLVQVYDFGEADGFFHLVMEFVEGASVLSLLQRESGPLDSGVAARIVLEAARGLAWAHGAVDDDQVPLGVVHRDISPDNLFVTTSGGTKVLDFGIARSRERSAVSVVGIVRGKPAYMAPEALLGDAIDGRADVWSLGVVFVEMLTGERLFTGEGLALARRVVEEPLSLSSLLALSSLPIAPSLTDIVRRMVVRDVAARATMTEVVAALEASSDVALPTAVLPALAARMPPSSSSSGSSSSSWAAVVAVRGEDEQTADLPAAAPPVVASPVDVVAVVAAVAAAADSVPGPQVAASSRRRVGAAGVVVVVAAVIVGGVFAFAGTSGRAVVEAEDAGVSTIDVTHHARLDSDAVVDAGVEAIDAGALQTTPTTTPTPLLLKTPPKTPTSPRKTTTPSTTPSTTTSTGTQKTPTTTTSEAPTGSAGLYVPDRRPWVDVFIDDVKVGVSPLGSRRRPFGVSAGSHRLKLVDPATGATVVERHLQLEVGAVEEVR
jgi:serine/threonine protein kinase